MITQKKKFSLPEIEKASSMSQSLQERIAAFPFWYHKIELPGGIVTPGWAPIDQDSYGVPQDLTGRQVLAVKTARVASLSGL